jgi:hypothetical protein
MPAQHRSPPWAPRPWGFHRRRDDRDFPTQWPEPVLGDNPAGYHGACRHQRRSNLDRHADAEHVGMCRGHDDEPGDTRHDDATESDGRTCNNWRIATIGRLLTGNPLWTHRATARHRSATAFDIAWE